MSEQNASCWVWLGGWGIDSSAMEAFALAHWPQKKHLCIEADALWLQKLEELAPDAEHLIAYSLGAFLLLRKAPRFTKNFQAISLLAPFIDLKQKQFGGLVHPTQLRYLQRQIQKNPNAAIADFYERSEIRWPPPKMLNTETLHWGLNQLLEKVDAVPQLPACRAFIGGKDTLIDAKLLQACWPSVEIAPHLSHDIGELGLHLKSCLK